jgi:hypothetical protein
MYRERLAASSEVLFICKTTVDQAITYGVVLYTMLKAAAMLVLEFDFMYIGKTAT